MKYFFSVFLKKKNIVLLIICMLSGFMVKSQYVGVSDLSSFSPASLFHVYKNSSGAMTLMQLANSTTGSGSGVGLTIDVLDASFNLNINNRYASYLSFSTSGTQRMTILSGGNVGIGTTNPNYKLDVQGGSMNVGTMYGSYVMYGTLGSFDTRSTNPNPEIYNMGVTSEFKANTSNGLSDGGTYNSVLSIRQWSAGGDWSGGGVHQIGFTQNGNIWHRYSQTSGVWGPWYKLYGSNNGGLITCASANYVIKSDGTNGTCSQIFDNGTNVGVGNASPGYKLHVSGDVYANGGWFRVSGNNGLYWESWGPGWYVQDGTWLRTYNNASIWANTGTIGTNGSFSGGYGGTSGPSGGAIFSGSVGIGTSSPSEKLQVVGKTTLSRDGTSECCSSGNYTLAISENTSGTGNKATIQFHNSGYDEGTIQLTSGGLSVGGNSRRFKMFDNQSVTMGLEITGKLYFGNSATRTESRDDAGLQGSSGAQSGFFETAAPANYPSGASSWWHLIDCRHSNNGNNYALQIAGSFFDQRLWFRKTNNNAAQPWTEILTTATPFSNFGQGFSQASATPNSVIVGDNSSTYSSACYAGYTTGNWFNVPGLSITRTITSGNIVAVNVHIRWKTDSRCYYTPETIWFRILRDGTEVARSSMMTTDPGFYILEGDGNIFYYDSGSGSGSHTYSVQAAMANTYTSYTESFQIMDGYITLMELKQ